MLAYLDRLKETCEFDTWRRAWVWHKGLAPKDKTYSWWMSEDKDELPAFPHYYWRDGYHTFKFAFFGVLYTSITMYGIFVHTKWVIYETWYQPFVGFGLSILAFSVIQTGYNMHIKKLIKKWTQAGHPQYINDVYLVNGVAV